MPKPRKSPDIATLRARTVAALEAARERLVELQKSIMDGEERLRHLDALLVLEGRKLPPRPAREDFLDACEQVMRAAGGTIPLQELRMALLRDGIPLPGQGTHANVILRLQRAPERFRRVQRGVYGLVGQADRRWAVRPIEE